MTDNLGLTSEQQFTVDVETYSFKIFPEALPDIAPGFSFAMAMTAEGATPPIQWTFSGSLPEGLSLDNAAGKLVTFPTGVPVTQQGTEWKFSVIATDANKIQSSRDYVIKIAETIPIQKLVIATRSLADVQAGGMYSASIAVTGGISPYNYTLVSGELLTGLTLNSSTGAISGTVPRAEIGKKASFSIKAVDSRGQSDEYPFSITVTPYTFVLAPDNLPSVTPNRAYTFKISAVGAEEPLSFSIVGSLPSGLSIDPATGTISGTVATGLQNTNHNFSVRCEDKNGVTVTKTYSAANSPANQLQVSSAEVTPALEIATLSLPVPIAGQPYSFAIAAAGGKTPYTFQLIADTGVTPPSGSVNTPPSWLLINTSTGELTTSSPTVPLTESQTPTKLYMFKVRLTDGNNNQVERSYSVGVQAHVLTVNPSTLPAARPGASYSIQLVGTGRESAFTGYAFTHTSGTMPSGLSISGTGLISGTVGEGEAGNARTFTVTVTDGVITSSQSLTINVNSFSITLATLLPQATEGSVYGGGTVTATGCAANSCVFEVSGTLPAGMAINCPISSNVCSFSGTPSQGSGSIPSTSYSLQFRARDSSGTLSTSTPVNLTVGLSVPVAAFSAPEATLNRPYSAFVTGSNGRTPYSRYSVFSGSLPAGLSINESTGEISGTPTTVITGCVAGQFALRVRDNYSPQQESSSLNTCINVAAIDVSTTTLANATENSVYTPVSLVAAGGTAPYIWELNSSPQSLPTGMSLSTAGVLSGTPSVGSGSVAGTTYSFQVRAVDSVGKPSAYRSLTLTVGASVPTVVVGTVPSAVLGTTYSHSISATGGRSPYTFSVTGGSLPGGILMSSSGVFSGLPASTGTCPAGNFTVSVLDALLQTSAGAVVCIPRQQGVSITNSTFPVITIGSSYNTTVTGTGGSTPYAFSATDLPSGISIHPTTGVLSGFTNAVSGDYTSYIVMSDSTTPTALSTTRAVTLQIRDLLALPAVSLPAAAAAPSPGIAYSSTAIAATGGVLPVVHSITSGFLPPGLTMSSNGAISGAPTYNAAIISSYNFTVTATDARSQTVSRSYTITAASAPRIVTKSLPHAVTGNTYAAAIERQGGMNEFSVATGATSRLTWTMSGHPTGLSIHSRSGKLSGTITGAAGTYNLLIGVTDGNGFSDSKTIPLVVSDLGKTFELGAPRFSDPCWRNGVSCEPAAYDVGTLTNTTQQFAAYSMHKQTAPFETSIIVARIDSKGRIPSLGENLFSVEVALPAIFRPAAAAVNITSLRIADLDQDGYKDIVFVNTTNRLLCSLWGSSSVTANGMPSGYSSSALTCWVIPDGFDFTNNIPVFITVRNDLRPDPTNYGKQDVILAVSSGVSTGSHVVIMRNNCALNADCSASRSSIFDGYAALLIGNMNNAVTITTTDTTGVANGLRVIGRGIPDNAVVSSFVLNTSITISAATTGGALNGVYISVINGGGGAVTASTTNASPTLTAVTSTAGMKQGQLITGTGIPAGSTVVSYTVNTITMSQNATATAAGISIKVAGPASVMPILGLAASSRMVSMWNIGVGYFDVAGPNPPTTYATSSGTCPQLMIGGHQQTGSTNGYLYIARQQWDGSQCLGDFQLHNPNANGERHIATTTHPWLSAVAVADFNNDGISDVSVGISQNTIALSENVRTFIMPGGQTFAGSTQIISQLQTQNALRVGVGRMIPYCLDGSYSCEYPSLLVTCDRAPVHGAALSLYSCLTILPNQCSSPGCTTAFESGTPNHRIDYPSITGQYDLPVLAPVVANGISRPTGNVTSGSNSISGVSSTSTISIGQPITGTGIPLNTVVTAKTANTITISQNATTTNSGVQLSSPIFYPTGDIVRDSDTIANVSDTTFFSIGQTITGSGIPANTTVSAKTVNSITLSQDATQSAKGVFLSGMLATPTGDVTNMSNTIENVSDTSFFRIGHAITGTGIPAHTIVTAKTATEITISKDATQSSSGTLLSTPSLHGRGGLDVILLGDNTAAPANTIIPFFMTYGRNGDSETDPLKAGLHMSGFPANYFVPVEIGTMKIGDMNNDDVPDLFANIVNQGSVSVYLSDILSSPIKGINSTQAPSYLATPTDFGCPSSEANCLPDPIFNTMGAQHGYPSTVGTWHMPNTMDIGDVDNDGVIDVSVIGYQSRGVSVALGTTAGDLSSSTLFDVGSGADVRPQAFAMADLDQDGFLDIVVASILATGQQTAYISWLKGNGDGSFDTAQAIPGIAALGGTCTDPRSIATPDLDNDGRPELAILCYNAPAASVINIARRHTSGVWLLQSNATINASGGANGTVMKWGRLTATSGLDVVVGGLAFPSTMRIINDVSLNVTPATGAFTVSSSPGSYMTLYGYVSDIDIADLNADGFGDILVSTQTSSGFTTHNGGVYYACLSSGVPGTCTLEGWGLEGFQISSVIARDINGDGLPDVFSGYRANANGTASLMYRTIGRSLNLSK